MNIFGWRLTNKPVQVETDEVTEFHALLTAEKKARKDAVKAEKVKAAKLKKELDAAKKEEAKRAKITVAKNKAVALVHLRKVERYTEMMDHAKGARKQEIAAIIAVRMEAVENLGIPMRKSVDLTIRELSHGT